jgi:hypothetical protein
MLNVDMRLCRAGPRDASFKGSYIRMKNNER